MYEKLFNHAPVQLPAGRLSIGDVLAQGLRKIVVAVERLPCAEDVYKRQGISFPFPQMDVHVKHN